VYVGDGLQQVVCLVHDDDAVLEVEPDGLPGGSMQESVVRQHHHLAQGHGRPAPDRGGFRLVISAVELNFQINGNTSNKDEKENCIAFPFTTELLYQCRYMNVKKLKGLVIKICCKNQFLD